MLVISGRCVRVRLPKLLLLLLLISLNATLMLLLISLNAASAEQRRICLSLYPQAIPLFPTACAQMLPGTLRSTLSSCGWPLPYNLSDGRDGVLQEETSVCFTFISSHSASSERQVASGRLKRKCQNAAVCQFCLYHSSNFFFFNFT